MRNTKPLLAAFAIAAIGAGITACNPASTTTASGTPATGTPGPSTATVTGAMSVTTGPGRYILQAMPKGTVTIARGDQGRLVAHVVMFGLTPGSAHSVSIASESGHTVTFPVFTADATGQADVTLTSLGNASHLPRDSRLIVRLGDAATGQLASEPIAETGVIDDGMGVFTLHAVTADANGVSFGRPAGRTTIAFDAAAQTLTVTVTASGLTPGAHAAHIHLGSCQSQGGVKYMLADFIADANGDIRHQTRAVTGVTSVPGPGNWYLNLHMGGMNQILANGMPTLYFRPMLCTDITSVAVTGSASPSASASGSASPSVSASPSASVPPTAPASASPSGYASSSATPSSSSSPSSVPTSYPTHW
jgi:hypothetical protein